MNTFTPAFLKNNSCKIYFALSEYNSQDQLLPNYPVQIIVQDIKTNKSVLSTSKYVSAIKLSPLNIDNNRTTKDKYYITISPSDLQNGSFLLNQYYKVQIRLCAAGASTPPQSGGLDTWLSENIAYFSEWSTVNLIYSISQPTLTLKNFKKDTSINIKSTLITLIGKTTFSDSADTETVKNYQIQLYDNENNLIENINNIFPINNNELNYTFTHNLEKNIKYTLITTVITKNLYTFSNTYYFYYNADLVPQLSSDIEIVEEQSSASIQLFLKSTYIDNTLTNNYKTGATLSINLIQPSVLPNINPIQNDTKISNSVSILDFNTGDSLVIRRSSSQNQFTQWEELYTTIIPNSSLPITILEIKDYTVEPGVWYKYQINKIANNTVTAAAVTSPHMVNAQDVFLSANNQQLRIRYNTQINNFSIKTSESLIETIGSPFPFIKRNSNIYYKTFSLSGLITCFMDEENQLFNVSEDKIYSFIENQYQNYKDKNKLSTSHRNYIYEKDFRNAVIHFLYKDDVKLFRSLTEGNMLVKLMNISLTPNNSLGRLIYEFSCTVYEIDKATYENYKKYQNNI